MKKIYAAFLTVALVATMVIPGFANPSPSAPVVKPSSPSTPSKPATVPTEVAEVINNETMPTVEVEGLDVKAASPELAKGVMLVAAMPSVLRDLGVAGNAKLESVMEFTYKGVIPAGGVQIPFVVKTAKVGDLVYILHRQASGQWEKVGQAILGADLKVVATFTSFSPVAIMVVDAATIEAPVVAPKTGE